MWPAGSAWATNPIWQEAEDAREQWLEQEGIGKPGIHLRTADDVASFCLVLLLVGAGLWWIGACQVGGAVIGGTIGVFLGELFQAGGLEEMPIPAGRWAIGEFAGMFLGGYIGVQIAKQVFKDAEAKEKQDGR